MLQCCAEKDKDSIDASQAAHIQWQSYTSADIEAAQASTSGRSNMSTSDLSNIFTNFVTQTYARSYILTDAPLYTMSAKAASHANVRSVPLLPITTFSDAHVTSI